VQFRVLEPPEVSAVEQPLRLGGPKQRTVLAVLAVNANELVPRDLLIASFGGDAPPAQAAARVRAHIARLRKLLAAQTDGRSIIETQRNGYVLRIDQETLDLVLGELRLSTLEHRVEARPPPRQHTRALLRRPRSRREVVALAVVAVVAAAAALLAGSRPLAAAASLQGNSIVAIDSRTNSVLGEVLVGGRPGGVAAGAGFIWVGNRDDKTLLRVGMRDRHVVETIGLGVEPIGVAVGAGSVWVLGRDGVVLQIDPLTNDVVASIEVSSEGVICCSDDIAFSQGAAWVAYRGLLARIDARTRRVKLTGFRTVRSIGSSGRALWAVLGDEFERIRRLEPLGDAVRLHDLDAIDGLGGLSADRLKLWTGSDNGTLLRIAPDTGRVTASLSLNRPIADVAMSPGGGVVWVAVLER
jgi:DNA-binding winged helix-turn-helix (wHTH) protein